MISASHTTTHGHRQTAEQPMGDIYPYSGFLNWIILTLSNSKTSEGMGDGSAGASFAVEQIRGDISQ